MADLNPLYVGFDWSETLEFEDEDGDPIVITGQTFEADIKEQNHSAVLLTLSGSQIAVTDGANGVLTLTLAGADTDVLWPVVERYPGQVRFYDLRLFRTDGGRREFQTLLKVKGITT